MQSLALRLARWGEGPGAGAIDPAAGAGTVFTVRARLALLAAFALVVMLRLPLAWLHGRFLDEEGTIFFAYAWHHDAGDAMWRSFGGYLNLAANGFTLLAARLVRGGVLPLEYAPYLTMTIALAFQMIPAALLLFGRATWLANRWAVIAALLILATSPMTEEVFYNVLHIQLHLALAAAIILALDPPRTRLGTIGCGAILFVGPLCGPAAIILLPFFALRTLLERDRARLFQTAMLGAGAAVQLLVFFYPSPVRGHFLDPVSLGAVLFVRMIAMPLSNSVVASLLSDRIFEDWNQSGFGWLLAPLALLGYFGTLIWLALRNRRDAAVWLIVPGLAMGAISFGGGMIINYTYDWFGLGAGQRYNFIPLVLVGLGLISLTRRLEGRARRWVAYLCFFTVVSGTITFWHPIEELRRGPAWRDQVALWQRDHHLLLRSWPRSWKVDLSEHKRPCSVPVPGQLSTTDPTYCESSWIIRVKNPETMESNVEP